MDHGSSSQATFEGFNHASRTFKQTSKKELYYISRRTTPHNAVQAAKL
jgi:hypothetical protein